MFSCSNFVAVFMISFNPSNAKSHFTFSSPDVKAFHRQVQVTLARRLMAPKANTTLTSFRIHSRFVIILVLELTSVSFLNQRMWCCSCCFYIWLHFQARSQQSTWFLLFWTWFNTFLVISYTLGRWRAWNKSTECWTAENLRRGKRIRNRFHTDRQQQNTNSWDNHGKFKCPSTWSGFLTDDYFSTKPSVTASWKLELNRKSQYNPMAIRSITTKHWLRQSR